MNKYSSALDQVRQGKINPTEVASAGWDILGVSFVCWIAAVMLSKFRTLDFESVILNGMTDVVFHLATLVAALTLALGTFVLLHAAMAWVLAPIKKKNEEEKNTK